MTILAVGIFGVFRAFLSSENAIRRASDNTTAMTIADSRMEPFFSVTHAQIGLTATVTRAGGRSYRVDTYLSWRSVSAGRNVKQTTIVVSKANEPRVLARRVVVRRLLRVATAGAAGAE
jgi:hypothetical protein